MYKSTQILSKPNNDFVPKRGTANAVEQCPMCNTH